MTENYIGVDVAKDWIDTFDPETGIGQRIGTENLAAFAKANRGRLVVAEASGGYERPLIAALEAAGTRYVRVNPRHARGTEAEGG